MTTADRIELARIISMLPTAEGLALSRMTERPWETARRRIAARAAAIEAAAWLLPDARLTARAKDLARRLARHAEKRHLPGAMPDDSLEQALGLILEVDHGRCVEWRTIYNVLQNSVLAFATAEPDGSGHASSQTDTTARTTAVVCVGDAA